MTGVIMTVLAQNRQIKPVKLSQYLKNFGIFLHVDFVKNYLVTSLFRGKNLIINTLYNSGKVKTNLAILLKQNGDQCTAIAIKCPELLN